MAISASIMKYDLLLTVVSYHFDLFIDKPWNERVGSGSDCIRLISGSFGTNTFMIKEIVIYPYCHIFLLYALGGNYLVEVYWSGQRYGLDYYKMTMTLMLAHMLCASIPWCKTVDVRWLVYNYSYVHFCLLWYIWSHHDHLLHMTLLSPRCHTLHVIPPFSILK